jgi:hypothetical protein
LSSVCWPKKLLSNATTKQNKTKTKEIQKNYKKIDNRTEDKNECVRKHFVLKKVIEFNENPWDQD